MQNEWIYCPACGGKARLQVRKDTELHFVDIDETND